MLIGIEELNVLHYSTTRVLNFIWYELRTNYQRDTQWYTLLWDCTVMWKVATFWNGQFCQKVEKYVGCWFYFCMQIWYHWSNLSFCIACLAPSQCKDGLFRYRDFYYKDKMVVSPSFLDNGNPYPHSKVHVANMGPTAPRWAPCWPHGLCSWSGYTWKIISSYRGETIRCRRFWWTLVKAKACYPLAQSHDLCWYWFFFSIRNTLVEFYPKFNQFHSK